MVVIGVGSEYRADDRAGLAALDMLADLVAVDVRLLRSDGEPVRLIEAWAEARAAIVIDSVAGSAGAAGTLHRLDVTASVGRLPAGRRTSSHEQGIGTAIALGIALDRMPGRLIVHGIQGADFGYGLALSPPVAARIGDLAAAVLADVRAVCAAC